MTSDMTWMQSTAESVTGERTLAALLGLLAGDAAGVAFECCPVDLLPDLWRMDLFSLPPDWEFTPPPGWDHPDMVPSGTYSEDGAGALVAFDSLTQMGRLVPGDFGERLLRWLDDGYLACDGKAFGVGGTTRRALDRIRAGTPAGVAGLADETAMGNAPLMRGLSLALWHTGNDKDLVISADALCAVTHAHVRPRVVTAACCLWVRFLLEDRDREPAGAARAAVARLISINQERPGAVPSQFFSEAVALYTALENLKPNGAGHIVQTFVSAVAAQRRRSFVDVVTEAVAFGNDTDSTAAAAGAIAGIRFGLDSIPRPWLETLNLRMPAEARAVLGRAGST